MKRYLLLLAIGLSVSSLRAQDTLTSSFFSTYLQTGDLVSYINYVNDDMLWEGETTGGWTMPERLLFTIRGNSYLWNRFYLNDFRVDSRFLSGSMLYVPDMRETSLVTDPQRGLLRLQHDSLRPNKLWLEGNMGGLGGISPGTQQAINIIHLTAQQRAWKEFQNRSHMLGAGQASAGFGIPSKQGRTYYQRLYVNGGSRRILTFDEGGENGFYDAPFYKVQLDGQLPMGAAEKEGWTMNYLLSTQHRPDLYSEFGYSHQEVADYTNYSASLYTSNQPLGLTTGLTYALHDARHQNLEFERNVVDQDGEGFDPWYADGALHELSWAVNYKHPFRGLPLTLRVDAYNSLLHFRPTAANWSNQVYSQFENQAREDWFSYHFESAPFTAGILENTAALDADYRRSWFTLHATLGLTADGLLLRDKAVAMPSWEAEVAMHFAPAKWFKADVVLGHYRTKYTWDQVRLLSSDYQYGTLSGPNAQYPYYGGRYLDVKRGLQMPQYAVLDIPFTFIAAGRHEFACLSTARLYYHNWQIRNNPDAEGRPYLLAEQEPVPGAGMFALPLYLSNTLRYTYRGEKVFFSLSWQSYQMSGLSTLGNGAENNSISSLTYSMLNPSTYENLKDQASPVKALNRLDQDKAYICRIQLGANITRNWQLMLNGHWQDGTPISSYRVQDGNIWQYDTKGINPSDSHFGMRKDMFFNVDMRLRYQGVLNRRNQDMAAAGAVPFSVELAGYNLWDFGTEWYECSFDQYLEHGRRAMSICIPRGLTLRLAIGLSANR